MVVLATLEGTLSVTADPWPSLPGVVEVEEPDAFFIDVDVDERAAVAFAQRFQRLGVRIDLDGVTLPDRDVANALTIEETADSFGDRLTFRLAGPRFSPMARALLRARTPVDVYFVTGSPEHEYIAKVFTGWVVSAPHDVQPATSNVTALDAAALYARRRALNFIVPPNSGKTRERIARELLTAGGIPIRTLDLGPNGGGKPAKAFSPGDKPILDVLRDYLSILGAELALIDGAAVAVRYDPGAAVVAELNPSNLLAPLVLTAPETLSANVLGVVSVSYSRVEPNGETTTETRVVTTAPYAKGVYAFRQTNVGGEAVLIPNGAGVPSADPKVVSEIITRTTRFGSIEKRVEQEEWGWYAFRAAGNRVAEIEDAPFYEMQPLPAYIYADGSTRATPAETFQTIRRMTRDKTTDDENRVIGIREERFFPRFHRKALWAVGFDPEDGLSETLIADLQPVNDDGDAVVDGREAIGRYGPDEITETAFTLDDDGTILEEVVTERSYTIGSKRPRAANAFGYGIDPRTYTNRISEALSPTFAPSHARVTTKRYRVISEDRYEITQTVRNGADVPTITTTTLVGAPPRPEQAQAEQTSQEIRAEVRDERRIVYAGDEEIADVEHNEYVETSAEAMAYARYRARLASATVLECTTPIESLIHKFKMIRVSLPLSSIDGLRFYVRSVRRDAATYRQDITAHHYAPDLD